MPTGEYEECVSCLEDSKGERHSEIAYIGPLKDVHVCKSATCSP